LYIFVLFNNSISEPKLGTIEPNDPTNEDIVDTTKLSSKEVRQKSVVEQWERARIPYQIDSDFGELKVDFL
jgi:hypothetical protein